MARLREEDIASIVEREIDQADGGEFGTTSLGENRRLAMNYYLGRARGDETDDNSRVQSLDVADQTEHMLAQMMSAFTTDTPAEFEADAPNDDSQAEVESAAVNKILMEDNAGYEVLYQAIKNALLNKNAIIKVWVEDDVDHETVTFDGLSGDESALLEASIPEDATVDGDDESLTVSRDRDRKRLRIEATENASFVLSANWHKQDLQDCPLVGQRKFIRRSELISMGFPRGKVSDLPSATMDASPDSLAKHPDQVVGAMQGETRGQDMIECWEAYTMLPRNLNDGNPESERWRVFMSNRTILDKERVDIVPFVSGTAFIMANRWHGLSLFDKLKEIQDMKTAGFRQFVDNQAHLNSNRAFIQGDVNRQELGINAPGHHVTGSLNSTMTPFPTTDFGASSIAFLNYCDKIRSERGGAAVDLGSPESQLVSSSIGASGVAMVMGAQEMMAGHMTRTLSEGLIRRLFLLIHRTAREVYRRPMMMKKADQWIPVNPAQWRARSRVNVKTGLSPGERARKVAALDRVLQTQISLMQAGFGGTMVSEKNVYIAWMNREKAAELDNPEQYAVHYESQEAQQAQQGKAQQQQQQQQLQQQVAEMDAKVKLVIAQMDDKTKRDIAILDSEVEEAKIVGKATGDLELEQLRARNASESEGNTGSNGRNQPVPGTG